MNQMILDHTNVLAEALENAFSLKEYVYLIEYIQDNAFTTTPEFRKLFNGFYTVRQKKAEWYDSYYSLMEQQKKSPLSFSDLLWKLYAVNNTIEVSFASKLIAAVNPDLPIWDQYVIRNLGYEKEWDRYRTKDAKERIEKAVSIYEDICRWYQEFLGTENGILCVKEFDKVLPGYADKISDVKKIDYWLWSKR